MNVTWIWDVSGERGDGEKTLTRSLVLEQVKERKILKGGNMPRRCPRTTHSTPNCSSVSEGCGCECVEL